MKVEDVEVLAVTVAEEMAIGVIEGDRFAILDE